MTVDVFRYPLVELYAGGDWHDVTEDVRHRSGIKVDRGRGGEDDSTPPQTCTVTFDDSSGAYNPRNPTGPYYGSLGRNTPLRVGLRLASTTFDTPVTNGWGSTDDVDGQTVYAWSTSGGAASNYNVAAGVATHALAAAGDVRLSYLSAVDLRNCEVRTTVTVPTSNVTGTSLGAGIAAANLVVHGQSTSDYYLLRLVIRTDESVTLDVFDAALLSVSGTATVVPGLTHTAGQALRVAFAVEGRTLRAKVWPTTAPEPFEWHKTVTDEDATGARPTLTGQAGWVGIRSSLVGGNTNGPITLSYSDFELRSPRFAGEVSTWPATRDVSGNNITVSVTASGIKRRAAQGASPLDSPLLRAIRGNSTAAFAYWPLEDRQRAVAEEVTAVRGTGRLSWVLPTVATNTAPQIRWASNRDLAGSGPLPEVTSSVLVGRLDPLTSAAAWYVVWCEKIHTTNGAYTQFTTGGTDPIYVVMLLDPGVSQTLLNLYLSQIGAGISVAMFTYDFGSVYAAEQPHLFRVDAVQSGGNVVFRLWIDGTQVASHTQNTFTLRGLELVQIGSVPNATGPTVIGHVAVYETTPPLSAIYEAFRGNPSETTAQRMKRLCAEEDVEFDWVGILESGTYPPVLGDTPRVGAQRSESLLSLLDDAATADAGILFEQRGLHGYHYRTRRSLYSQPAALTLDYDNGEIAPPWRPVDDDRFTRNDVTAARTDGGSYRHEVTTGRLSTAAPEDGGAGRYRDSIDVNVQSDTQLPGIAEWRAHLGTVDEVRYPVVTVQAHGHALRGNASAQFALLDLDAGDRLVIDNAPDTPDAVNQLVVGYTEWITEHEHEFGLVCVPGSPYEVLVLGDASRGRLGSDVTTLAEDLDTTETAVDVQIAAGGALWTTNAGDWPFRIVVGGEVMTVTAVSGSSSPQTFTVTRSTNGVVKTHVTGAAVALADPIHLGL